MSLLALQQDFRSWLTSESADAGARLEPGAAPGLSVYLNNYRGSLIACLTENYEATHAWLGDGDFAAAAATHIDHLLPHSWTLDAYALGFPKTLEARYPVDPEVADLARLECALGVAFVGPDADPIDPAALADIDWDRAVLRFLPTLTMLQVTSNAGAIWSAISAGEQPPDPQLLPEPAAVAVWRSGFTPAFRTLETDETQALRRMMGGLSFGNLCAQLVDQHGAQQGPAMAGTLLGQWLQDGFIHAIGSPVSPD